MKDRTRRAASGHLFAAAMLAVALAGLSPAADAQDHDQDAAADQLGSIHFATSCNPSVEAAFNHGVALLHSFWFSASIKTFNEVLQQDPSCVMAYWGIAMSEWGNPFTTYRSPQTLFAGMAAVDQAEAAGFKTDRERAYLMAVKKLYQNAASISEPTRTAAYEEAMAHLTAAYPDDIEARIFYALAIDQDIDPTDKTYAQRLKVGAILEKEFAKQPDHPGLAHYIIHTYDVPALASRALIAARQYAKIAPAAPHALHMPSHTFTRLGLWQESIDTNIKSAAAARKDPNAAAEQLHAFDYMVYAYLQTGQDAAARAVVSSIAPIGAAIPVNAPGNAAPPSAGYYALAEIPARYAIERNAWSEAAVLQPRETSFPWVDAVTYFARGLGAARSGNPAAAAKDAEKLGQLRDALLASKSTYWAEQVAIQQLVVTALIAFDEGRSSEALTTLQEATRREDATDKAAVSPGPLKPARELLAEMLLQLNRPKEALSEFEQVMRKEPNRFRAIYGAIQSASVLGAQLKAHKYEASLVEICEQGDIPGRPELQKARTALTQ